jgi:hypothetical protein
MKTQNNYIDQPIHLDLFSRGYDEFGQNPLSFLGSEKNLKSQTMFEAGVPSNFIQDGDTIVRLNVVDGYLQSDDFVSGESGWRIDSDGNVEFGSGYFRGDITGASGTFTGDITGASGNFSGDITGASGTFGNLSLNVTEEAIIVNDGTNDRVLIGKGVGLF